MISTGKLPRGWTHRPLEKCGRWVSGGTPSTSNAEYWDGRIPWISAKSLKTFRLSDSDDKVTELGAEQGTTLVPAGTVLFVVRGMSLANEFRVGVTTRSVTFNQDLRGILPSPDIDPLYLARYLRSASVNILGKTDNASHGTKRLPTDRLGSLMVPVPPLREQQQIAAILDKADEIREKGTEAMRINSDVIYSVYLDRFGDPVTNTQNQDSKIVDDLCNLVRGSSPRPKGDPRYFGGPVKRLMVEDITRDGRLVTPAIDTLTDEGARFSRPCPAGTVVMVVSGNVGLPARLAVDACIHDGFVGFLNLDERRVLPDFFVLTLEMLKVTHERTKAGAIWQNLTTHQVKAMRIPLPPIESQRWFAKFVRRQEEATNTLRLKRAEEQRIFHSLAERAFQGLL